MLRNVFTLTPRSKRLIMIMFGVTVVTLIIAYLYYENYNQADDPRTKDIKQMYGRYNQYVRENNAYKALAVLDSMETAYNSINHYSDSFETGVINTDKAAIYITMALYQTNDEVEKKTYLAIADSSLTRSLTIYNRWEENYAELDEATIISIVEEDFADITHKREKIIERRIA
ncbi:MAG: hypothetical protein K8S56_07575, partial [Candidatus Cloacimonetes bacterium]|nr:hypothetical protein [Candidatus Cloacimonadota bacterium]